MSDKGAILARIKEYYSFNTDTDLADFLGIQRSTLSNWVKRDSIDYDLVFSKCKQIDKNWLLTGQGEMLKSDKGIQVKFYESENAPIGRKLIPFYDTEAAAGTLRVSNMDPVSEAAEYIDAGDWFLDADSAMRVHGDSMFPEYKSGSIVVMREVFDKRLIVYGEDYMIQTNEYKTIKRLMQSGEKGCWLACSVNDEIWEVGPLKGRLVHEPFPIYIDDVTKICRILGCVKRAESSRIV